MEKNRQFQYEIQEYQENCVNNIISLFDALKQGSNFVEVMTAHKRKNKYNFPIKNNKNIDIMMETGTGKTFTFLKAIFELNKHYGYKKFIILIPSVPIREGTKTNLKDTKDYFKSYYANEKEKEIESFVYEGGNISAIAQFINSAHLSVLVITPSSFNSKENILNRPLEREMNQPELFISNKEPPNSYLECLKRLQPIVIMDEPHRFEGDAFKTYFEGFDNYYLRFGASFPNKKGCVPLSNVAYILDSISSFRQYLVKKIVVFTQDIVENKESLIGIEGKKAIVNTLINGFITKRKLGLGDIFNGKSIKKINKDYVILADDSIEKVDYSLSDESLKHMIRQTIKIHFEKEEMLFRQGIKALTLFFIASDVSLFRGENPKIKHFFEEEYIKQRSQVIKIFKQSDEYYKYLQNDFDVDGNLNVHKGYFSGDKGNSDDKIKVGVDEILKDKKKLLSFESPTRFIFSIWALQEGWDNPNVFTICKLSNQGSEISKLQQIGRGLRLCVNQNLERITLKKLDGDIEAFWKINNLDVVVSNKEQGFVDAIQNEILSNSFLMSKTFTEQELKIALKEKGGFDDIMVRKLYRTMENSKMIIFKNIVDGIDILEKSPDFSALLQKQNLPQEEKDILESLFTEDASNYVQKAENKKEKKKIFIKASHLQEFKNLWEAINKNSFYVLAKLEDSQETELIANIKRQIEKLNIEEIFLETKRAELNVGNIGAADAITEKLTSAISYKSKVDYLDLALTLSNNTHTPLSFIVKIFNALSEDFKRKMLCNNPKQAQKEIAKIINDNLIEVLKANIRYDSINGAGSQNVFKTGYSKDKNQNKIYLDTGSVGKFQKDITSNFSLKDKWIFEEVIEYDSDFELQCIEKDADIEAIEIFGKLPRLKIHTPLGSYNPDFCYVIKCKEGKKLFLIVEAKGYDTKTEIPKNEDAKIDFAKKYFESLNASLQNKNIKISFKDREKDMQLVALIDKN